MISLQMQDLSDSMYIYLKLSVQKNDNINCLVNEEQHENLYDTEYLQSMQNHDQNLSLGHLKVNT